MYYLIAKALKATGYNLWGCWNAHSSSAKASQAGGQCGFWFTFTTYFLSMWTLTPYTSCIQVWNCKALEVTITPKYLPWCYSLMAFSFSTPVCTWRINSSRAHLNHWFPAHVLQSLGNPWKTRVCMKQRRKSKFICARQHATYVKFLKESALLLENLGVHKSQRTEERLT